MSLTWGEITVEKDKLLKLTQECGQPVYWKSGEKRGKDEKGRPASIQTVRVFFDLRPWEDTGRTFSRKNAIATAKKFSSVSSLKKTLSSLYPTPEAKAKNAKRKKATKAKKSKKAVKKK